MEHLFIKHPNSNGFFIVKSDNGNVCFAWVYNKVIKTGLYCLLESGKRTALKSYLSITITKS